jgi:sodium/hydrogen exchanger 8
VCITDSELFEWDWSFIRASVGVCLVARALNTFPLCALANVCRSEPIPISYMVVIWFAGLRGAIAFALALNIRTCGKPSERSHSAILRAATLFTVLFTTIVSVCA